jgi:multiple sugar transport system ATP-binding protein
LIADDRTLFNARIDSRQPVRAGETVELAVDNRRLHFFDSASGDAVRSE